jgi:hypothetical protein
MAENWPLLDALIGGTPAMRKAGKVLLPQFDGETNDDYEQRRRSAVLFNVFARTSSVMSSKPFAKPMKLDAVAPLVAEHFPDVDGKGTDIHAFCGKLMLACLQKGLHGVLVDVPPKPKNVRTRADDRAAGIRPYFCDYSCNEVLGWQTDESGELIQLRLMETVYEPHGTWGKKAVKQVRVLAPYAWEIWRQKTTNAGDEWVLHAKGKMGLGKIPFVFFYGLRDGFGIGRSPLLDLAYMNVEHWQSSSDQQTILHVVCGGA